MTSVAADRSNATTFTDVNSEISSTQNSASAELSAQWHSARNLTDWKTSHADIRLLPLSCIDIYTDLVTRGNPVPLLSESAGALNESFAATYSVLGTRHQVEDLHQRCRQLESITANSTQPGQNTLYLAAGFIAHGSNGETKHAPVLLIPVSIERMHGRGSAYAVRYESGRHFRINPHIAELCSDHIEQQIKPFENTTDLREFLHLTKSRVHKDYSCKVTANTGIISLPAGTLEQLSNEALVDLELERTRPGIKFMPLPATPDAFDPQLAIKILRFVEPENLQTALDNLAGQLNTTTGYVKNADPDIDEASLANYHNCAGWLIDIGLGHWKLKNIARLPRRVQEMETNINQLLAASEFNRYFDEKYHTVDMLYRLNKAKDRILNSPSEMLHHSISQHADSETSMLLQQAKIQASSLEHEMAQFDENFNMSALPGSKTLSRLIDLVARREEESQLDNPEYFRARRTLNEVLNQHHGVLTDNDILSHDLGSALLVAQFADQWGSFQRDFRSIASNIEAAASSAHKLCALIPLFINKDTSLAHASRTAEKFRCRIDPWQKYLRKNYADTELTPFQMLSHMDLGNPGYPQITLSQHPYDERIYRHIAANTLSENTIATTSQWLSNVMFRLGTDTATIRRFLDRESSLQSNLN